MRRTAVGAPGAGWPPAAVQMFGLGFGYPLDMTHM